MTCVLSEAAFAGLPPSMDPQGLARNTAARPMGLPTILAPLTLAKVVLKGPDEPLGVNNQFPRWID